MVEIELSSAAVIFIAAFVFELIDSSLGQGFGTLGSPTYILVGYQPKLIVPAILLSQAVGGLCATYMHNFWGNASFWGKKSDRAIAKEGAPQDFRAVPNSNIRPDIWQVTSIIIPGVIAASLAAYLGVKLTGQEITVYMGILVLAIGILVVSGIGFKFSWKKMIAVATFSAANKSLTGGGYGPVTCGGQVLCGTEGKRAVAITDFAEPFICIAGFTIWMLMSYKPEFVPIVAPMAVGAGLGGLIGPWFTYKTPPKWFKYLLGFVFVMLGIAVLLMKGIIKA